MHDIVLQSPTSADQLRPPLNTDMIKGGLVSAEPLSSAHINALSACLTAIDAVFDTFLAMDVPAVRCLPVFSLVRVVAPSSSS